MSKVPETNIEVLEKKKAVLEQVKEKRQTLIEQQEKELHELIVNYHSIAGWYRDHGFYFTHPTINYRTSLGPILGYDENEDCLIVYNVETERIVGSVARGSTNKTYFIEDIISGGYYLDARAGIEYLDIMIDNYIKKNEENIKELENELK